MSCVVTSLKGSLSFSLYLARAVRTRDWFLCFTMAFKVGYSIICTIGSKY